MNDIWGADRMDHMDSKSMQPGETPGHLAILICGPDGRGISLSARKQKYKI